MGPQSQHGAQALTRAARIFAAALTSAAAAAAAETAPFRFADADLRLAWEESAASFVTPSFDDYVAARNQAFIEAVPELFDGGASGAPRTGKSERPGSRSLTEIEASGGSGRRLELAAFQGWEINFVDAAASFRDKRAASGDGAYVKNYMRADAEVAFSDQAGTTVGFAANYEGNAEKLRPEEIRAAGEAGDNIARSGAGSAGFRSNLWGKAKFATKVSGTFTGGEYRERNIVDQVITSDSSYDFFWLGENLSRGLFSISQENYDLDGNGQGFLTGKLSLENDFPIADRLYLLGGFGAYLFRSDRPEFRFYPQGRLLLRLTSRWGYFVNYRPQMNVPSFRTLYVHRDYAVPTDFRPVEDKHFAVRTGLSYHFQSLGRITAAAYEERFRRTYAAADSYFGAVGYYDPGRARIRGVDASYRITLARVEHYAGAAYRSVRLYQAPGNRFPYLPTYDGTAGLTLKFGRGHSASVEGTFLGERYATPTAAEPLGAAWVPNANVVIRIQPGISVTTAAENITNERYYEAAGVLAPGRSFRVGANFVF
jgi:hypothetical protein